MNNLFKLIVILSINFSGFSQTDFNEYKTLQSSGNIPIDFSIETYNKIEQSLKEGRKEIGSQLEQREFLEQTGYAIDELLHSGLVVYGDPLSTYVSEVAKKLLTDNPDLLSKLRFYTLKTNNTNAFSTDQGIIFVTSGLLSQLTSESQLAFILAHEISHYTEKHVVETFAWKKSNKFENDWIGQMSIYSKEKEFDADRIAVEMYRKAGYARDEIIPTFDVLLYSYLPFDELEISLDYFASDQMYLHPMLFPKKEYTIKADEESDDSESSHPNIKKRKIAAQKAIDSVGGTWGADQFKLSQDHFFEIRNIARFERIRTDIMNARYADAVYSIYLLEKSFPASIYLKRMKAQAWLGLYQYEKAGKISSTLQNKADYEGQSAKVHYMIRKFNRSSLTSMALRNVYDQHKAHPDDIEISAIYEFLIKELGYDEKFEIDNFYPITFTAAIDSNRVKQERKQLKKPEIQETDTLVKKSSKYDRIKKSKVTANDPIKRIDSLNYYAYGLSDLVSDTTFNRLLARAKLFAQEKKDQNLRTSTGKRKNHFDAYDNLKIETNNIILVEPRIFDFGKRSNEVDFVKSELLEKQFSSAIEIAAEEADIIVQQMNSSQLEATNTFNERSLMFSCRRQLSNNANVKTFPVDFVLLNEIVRDYNTSEVMFSTVSHSYDPDIKAGYILLSAIIYPTFPMVFIYVPLKIIAGNHTNLSLLVLDISTGEVMANESFYFNETISKYNLSNRMYSIFKHLSLSPNY